MTLNRRDVLTFAAAASVLTLCGIPGTAFAQNVDQAALANVAGGIVDKPIGSETAPVTVIEYASPTCPHCAAFHNDVYPAFKAQFVDTGKAKFIVRPFVRNVLDAVVFMLAEAAGPMAYHNVVETYFKTQNQWGTSNTPRDALLDIALQLGFTQESFEAALTNQELFAGLEAARDQALNEFGLTGTPTFYINGKQFSGEMTIEQFAAEIDPIAGDVPAPAAPAAEPGAATPVAPAAGAAAPAAPAEGAATPVAPGAATPVAPAPATP